MAQAMAAPTEGPGTATRVTPATRGRALAGTNFRVF